MSHFKHPPPYPIPQDNLIMYHQKMCDPFPSTMMISMCLKTILVVTLNLTKTGSAMPDSSLVLSFV